eukprot:7377720-Prymnesium_polylepis.1
MERRLLGNGGVRKLMRCMKKGHPISVHRQVMPSKSWPQHALQRRRSGCATRRTRTWRATPSQPRCPPPRDHFARRERSYVLLSRRAGALSSIQGHPARQIQNERRQLRAWPVSLPDLRQSFAQQ